MTAPYVLMIMFMSGTFSSEIKLHDITMSNKEACSNAARQLADTSSNVGFICLDTATGEIFRFGKFK